MHEPLIEPLFEIENWRGGWYYKLGSRYTGPFKRRDNAVAAARAEVDPAVAPSSSSLRTSLTSRRPIEASHESLKPGGLQRQMLLGMDFRIPGVGDQA